MAPPSAEELLIRDYLSRLSVAARGQLSAAERRALLKSTLEFIEEQTSLSGRPHPMDVAKLLTRLGDPADLVRMERQRLAALRGEDFEESEQQGHGMVARVLRREGGRFAGTWHRAAQEGGAGLRLTLLDRGRAEDTAAGYAPGGDATASDATAGDASRAARAGTRPARWPQRPSLVPVSPDDETRHRDALDTTDSGPPVSGRTVSGRTVSGIVVPGIVVPDSEVSARYESAGDDLAAGDSGYAGPGSDGAGHAGPGHDASGHGQAADDDTPAYGMQTFADGAGAEPGGWLLNEIAGPAELLEPVDPAGRSQAARAFDRAARQVAGFIRSMPGRWRRHPVEVTALLLLGPVGFVFPPLWLIGALIALASKLWHPLDKWAGLATPVLLTVIAFVLGFIYGGTTHLGHDVHDGWAVAVTVSRFSALLSAGYLAWRARRGRRPAPLPPWKRAR